MPSNASDEMDEFFDFSALDPYHGLGEPHDTEQIQHATTYSADNITAMDWAMDWTIKSSTICPRDTILPHEVQAYEGSNVIHTVQHPQQWRRTDENVDSVVSRTDDSMDLTTNFTWPTDNSTPGNELMNSGFYASTSPSSSSYVSLGLTVDNDDKGSVVVLGAALESIPSEHEQSASMLETTQSALPSRLSLRQAPNASRKPASAKRKGPQSRIPLEAKQILEDEFASNPYPCSWEMDIIAHQANLDVKKVRNWFNNTRARKKGEGERFQHYLPLLY